MIVIGTPYVGVGDLDGAVEVGRQQGEDDDLAIFRRAEQRLALLEILGEHFRRGRRNVPGLGGTEHGVVDGALLVLVAVQRLGARLRCRRIATDRE